MAPEASYTVRRGATVFQERLAASSANDASAQAGSASNCNTPFKENKEKPGVAGTAQQKKVPPVRIKLPQALRRSTRTRKPRRQVSSSEDESESLESTIPDEVSDSSDEEVENNVEGLSAAERGLQLKVVNVQAHCHFKVRLDLLNIAQRARNTEYDKAKRSGVMVRFRHPSVTGTLYETGRAKVQGGCTLTEMGKAAEKFGRLLRKLGYNAAKVHNYKVTNVMATCDVKYEVELDKMAAKHHMDTYYEPELSPALDYDLAAPKVSIKVQKTGKVAFTGAKSQADLETALDHILPILDSCRRKRR